MQNRYSRWFGNSRDEQDFPPQRIDAGVPGLDADRSNSAEDVLGEIGLVLVVALGVVVAVNMLLTALHVG